MTDDGMMTTDNSPDPLTMILAKLTDVEARLNELTSENTEIKKQNAQLVTTNVKLMQQASPPTPEPTLNVNEVAYNTFIQSLLRGKQ